MLTLQPESKDVTCACIPCEHANGHGTRDFMADMDQLAEFYIMPLIPREVAIPKCLNSCCHEGLMGLARVHLHLTFTHVNYVLFPIKAFLMWASMKHDHFS